MLKYCTKVETLHATSLLINNDINISAHPGYLLPLAFVEESDDLDEDDFDVEDLDEDELLLCVADELLRDEEELLPCDTLVP